MSRGVRRATTAVGAVGLLIVVCAQVAVAQNGTSAGRCTGLAPGASWICQGVFAVIERIVGEIQAAVRGLFAAAVEFIVTTPAPYADGERALLQRPDNGPWPALYDLYLTRLLPIGLGLWGLFVLLVQFTRLFTATTGGQYRRSRLTRRAAFAVLLLIAWWPVGAFALHLADALIQTLAPSGAQLLSTVAEFRANIAGGLLIAGLVYLSAGVVALLLVALFLARFVVIFAFMPLMPVVIALAIIDEGPFKPVAGVAKSVGSLFAPFVFLPLPTAGILLVGYTIQDALRQSLASTPVLSATQPGATSAYAVILVVFWLLALLAPILVLLGSRGVYPLAFLGAGFIAGRSVSIAGVRGSSITRGATSAASTAGPTAAAGTGAATGSGLGSPAPLPRRPAAAGLPAGSDSGGAGEGSTGGGGELGDGAGQSGTGVSESLSAQASPATWSELDTALADDRRYEFGVGADGEFRPMNSAPPNTTKESILRGRVQQMAKTDHFAGRSEMYLRDDQGTHYDLSALLQRVRTETQFEQHGRDIVRAAQPHGADDTRAGSDTTLHNDT